MAGALVSFFGALRIGWAATVYCFLLTFAATFLAGDLTVFTFAVFFTVLTAFAVPLATAFATMPPPGIKFDAINTAAPAF